MNYGSVIQALVDKGVEFVVIGGWARILHGSSYLTNNLDICYSQRSDNMKRLAELTLSTDVGAIDLLAEVRGVGDYEQVKAHSVPIHAFDREVWTLDLPSLIKAKRAAGREKDLRVLPELEALLEAQEPD